ncbi:MAG: hypothetical protein ACLGGV_10205, partial [Bacteroidia bacterium]
MAWAYRLKQLFPLSRRSSRGPTMNNLMPCITDSDEFRYPEEEAEEESPLTLVEQQIEWLCDDWKDALANDSFD